MINYAFIMIILSIFLLCYGILFSKTFLEKIAFLGNFNNHIIIVIVMLSLFNGNANFIDIAFIYALLGFITNLAILKKYRDKRL